MNVRVGRDFVTSTSLMDWIIRQQSPPFFNFNEVKKQMYLQNGTSYINVCKSILHREDRGLSQLSQGSGETLNQRSIHLLLIFISDTNRESQRLFSLLFYLHILSFFFYTIMMIMDREVEYTNIY